MLKDFKEFAMKGNMVDMAVGIVIGAAFGTVIKSLVSDMLMPPIGLLMGGVSFSDLFLVLREGATAGPYATLAVAQEAGAVTMNWGIWIDNIISFLIVAFAVFMIVRAMNKAKKQEEAAPTTKDCPFCASAIPIPAKRCPNCTSELAA